MPDLRNDQFGAGRIVVVMVIQKPIMGPHRQYPGGQQQDQTELAQPIDHRGLFDPTERVSLRPNRANSASPKTPQSLFCRMIRDMDIGSPGKTERIRPLTVGPGTNPTPRFV